MRPWRLRSFDLRLTPLRSARAAAIAAMACAALIGEASGQLADEDNDVELLLEHGPRRISVRAMVENLPTVDTHDTGCLADTAK